MERIRTWLARPHVSRWWGRPDDVFAEVREHADDAHALILVAGRPVGYVLWQRLDRQELAAAGLGDLPVDHVDVDILIGEFEWMGRGVGPTALSLVAHRLRAEGVSSAGLGTDVANEVALRAFEKAGFRSMHDFEEDGREMCYLTCDLTTMR